MTHAVFQNQADVAAGVLNSGVGLNAKSPKSDRSFMSLPDFVPALLCLARMLILYSCNVHATLV